MLDVECRPWLHSCNFNKHRGELIKIFIYACLLAGNIAYMPPVPSGLSTFDFLNSSAVWAAIRTGCQVDTTKSLQGSLTKEMLPYTPFSGKFMDPFVMKNKPQLSSLGQRLALCSVFIRCSVLIQQRLKV